MTRQQISDFEGLQGQLESLHQELTTLVKKSPTDLVNKFKLTIVNSIVTSSNELLGKVRKPLQDFNSFDDSDLPSNSDVLLVIGQYLSAFEKLRGDNISMNYNEDGWVWLLTDAHGKRSERSSIQTAPPKKIAKK